MRVALVTKGFGYSENDWCLPALIDFVRALARQVEVDVYTLIYPHQTRAYHLHGARVFSFGGRGEGPVSRHLKNRSVIRQISARHRASSYDIIHAVWADSSAIPARRAAQALGVPLVTTFFAGEGVWLPDVPYGNLHRAANKAALQDVLAASAAVTCGSRFLAELLAHQFQKDITPLPLGIDTARFSPDGPSIRGDKRMQVMTVASLNPVKGLETLMQAFRQLLDRKPGLADHITWRLVGPDAHDRVQRNQLHDLVANLPVQILDGQPHWEMAQYYRGTDLVVQGSHYESQGVAVMEAAACGVPSAGTSVGILPELASQDWRCPPGDVDAMTDLLERLTDHPEAWPKEADRQRDWVHQHGTVGRCVDSFLDVYRTSTATHPG